MVHENRPPHRHINEVSHEQESVDIEGHPPEPQIDALNTSRKIDYSLYECFNCRKTGHSFFYCPEEYRNLFCFKCGKSGFTTLKCPNYPHQGNGRLSEKATGDTRSPQLSPSFSAK